MASTVFLALFAWALYRSCFSQDAADKAKVDEILRQRMAEKYGDDSDNETTGPKSRQEKRRMKWEKGKKKVEWNDDEMEEVKVVGQNADQMGINYENPFRDDEEMTAAEKKWMERKQERKARQQAMWDY